MAAPVLTAEEPSVRVAILQEVPSLRVTMPGPCRMTDLKSGALLTEWPVLKWKEIRPGNAGLLVGQEEVPLQAISLEPVGNPVFNINGRPYRGKLILYRTPRGQITAVNRLNLEEYLVGALTSETSPQWPLEVLRAHAVVSRTVVAHRIWIRKNEPFDVAADTSTHLYHGVSAERETTREAVTKTRGQVLTYQGELFSASFHASCGGHTEDASELWQSTKVLPPLKGREDPYCRDLRHYRWTTRMNQPEFLSAVKLDEEALRRLTDCEVLDRNASGRVRAVQLIGEKKVVTLTGKRLRELLGANRLRSLKFSISMEGDYLVFEGYGWGHGVGFCQWGAYGMARKGKKMDEILTFYFPGAQRRSLKGLPGFS